MSSEDVNGGHGIRLDADDGKIEGSGYAADVWKASHVTYHLAFRIDGINLAVLRALEQLIHHGIAKRGGAVRRADQGNGLPVKQSFQAIAPAFGTLGAGEDLHDVFHHLHTFRLGHGLC
jgi:hypothetical protein